MEGDKMKTPSGHGPSGWAPPQALEDGLEAVEAASEASARAVKPKGIWKLRGELRDLVRHHQDQEPYDPRLAAVIAELQGACWDALPPERKESLRLYDPAEAARVYMHGGE